MTFLQQLYNALPVGAVYIAVALGISLIYGLTRIVNFAHGQLLTLGAYSTFELVNRGLPFFLAIICSMIIVALIGALLDVLLFRRTLEAPLNGFIVSLGLIVVFQAGVVLIWGRERRQVDAPIAGTTEVGGLVFDHPRLVLLAGTVIAVIVLFVLLERTKAGRGMRALAERPTAARLVGVPVSRYINLTFMLGSGLAAFTGGLLAATFPFDAYSGFDYVLKGFAVAIIGGLGSVIGAVVAGLILAFAETLGAAYFDIGWAPAFGLAVTALIILVRPAGLFRGAGSEGESHFSLGKGQALTLALAAKLRHSDDTTRTRLRAIRAAGVALTAVALVLAPTVLGSARSLSVLTNMAIMAIAAYAFWFTFRHAGIFSMASAAAMGVGAYAAVIAQTRWETGFWLQMILAIAMAAAAMAVIGFIALRTSASYLVILTLMLSQLVILILNNWKSLTRGSLGMVNRESPPTVLGIDLSTQENFYYLVLVLLGLSVGVIAAILRTPYGRRLATIRENESLARSLGINAFRDKLIAFTVFGAISGLSGMLLLHYLRFIQPTTFSVHLAIDIQTIVLLGGAGLVGGPILGAALLAFIPELLGLEPTQAELATGAVLIALILFLPSGIGGLIQRTYLRIIDRLRPGTPPGEARPPTAPGVEPAGPPEPRHAATPAQPVLTPGGDA